MVFMKNRRVLIKTTLSLFVLLVLLSTVLVSAKNLNVLENTGKEPNKSITENADKIATDEKSESSISRIDETGREIVVESKKEAETKKLIIDDKDNVYKYAETRKADGVDQKCDLEIYKSDDGVKVGFDKTTGNLSYYDTEEYPVGQITADSVTADEAQQIAEEFAKQYCDISKFKLTESKYNEFVGYMITYSRQIDGYDTAECIALSVLENGNIGYFKYDSYVFDNIDINNISVDKDRVMAQVDIKMKEMSGDDVEYRIKKMSLAPAENDKVVMKVSVSYISDTPKKGVVLSVPIE